MIDRPIFLIGLPRTGTTIIYNTLCNHNSTAYFCSAWKKHIPLKLFRRLKGEPRPLEGWIWKNHNDMEYMIEKDATIIEKIRLKDEIEHCQKYWKRSRFINKNPHNTLRIRFLNEIFPDAYFIGILRDPTASIKSIYKYLLANWERDYTFEYNDKNFHGWHTIYERFKGNSTSKLISIINYFDYHRQKLLQDLKLVKNSRIINYEDFVKDPTIESKKLFVFAELDPEYTKELPKVLENMNNKYDEEFTDEQNEIISSYLKTLKYQPYPNLK